jgi:NAD(P)-dependent dehydrogenase (short-subunit alcohol dehydrogenase family)
MAKVVCITGVAGGIGAATAEIFAQADWHVVGVDCRESQPQSDSVTRFIRADISDIKTIEKIFDEMAEQEGRLDVLVNNAAIQIVKPLVDLNPEEWDMLMAVNVRAAYLAIKYAFPLLRRQGGSIINVSSVHAIATSKHMAAYAASKSALAALTRAAAIELAVDKIRVNAVLPGAIDTDMLRAGLSRDHVKGNSLNDRLDFLRQKHILGRIGQPEEIAEIIFFLAHGRGSSFMTGQSIVVDGGAIVKLSTE